MQDLEKMIREEKQVTKELRAALEQSRNGIAVKATGMSAKLATAKALLDKTKSPAASKASACHGH